MLRFSLGLTQANRVRNEEVRRILGTRGLGEKAREQRLRWYWHMRRGEETYVGQRMLVMVAPGKRRRGRPQRRYTDNMREEKRELGAKETAHKTEGGGTPLHAVVALIDRAKPKVKEEDFPMKILTNSVVAIFILIWRQY